MELDKLFQQIGDDIWLNSHSSVMLKETNNHTENMSSLTDEQEHHKSKKILDAFEMLLLLCTGQTWKRRISIQNASISSTSCFYL